MLRRSALLTVSCLLGVASLLTGCALQTTAAPSPDLIPAATISGTVHGASQPVFGAKVYLLAVNPTGYGGPGITASTSNAAISLLSATAGSVTPDAIGNYTTTNNTTGGFSISATGAYSCTLGYTQGATVPTVTLSGSEQVYLYVLGGNQPGIGANASSGMLAALGPCSGLSSSVQVTVNEITTVATAYAFAGFASDATHIGSSGSTLALTNLNNAYANVANLAVITSGTAAATYGTNIIRPGPTVTTIADILAACVNGITGNSSCNTLLSYTRIAGATGSAASDTATAAIYLAHNPFPSSAGMTALYSLVPSTGAPFAGGLSAQPNDFTLGIYLSSSNCFNNSAYGMAIDAAGNAWSIGGHGLCKFSNSGAAFNANAGYTGGGFYAGINLAIDTSGNVWVPNLGKNTLSEFSNSGVALSPATTGYPASGSNGGLGSPGSVAIDASGNVWIGNRSPGTMSKFSSSGVAVSPSGGYTDGSTNVAYIGVAVDAAGAVWATNSLNGSLSKFNASTGVAISPANGYYGSGGANGNGGLSNPYGVAIDATGNVWAANYYSSTVSKYSNAGAPISGPGGYTAGGTSSPYNVAIDSAGNVWVANFNSNSISELTNAGVGLTPNPAYTGSGTIYGAVNVAIDGSGNVWVTNYNGNIVEMIGAAAPVVTPMAANLVSPYGSIAVNRP